ncbi:MAG: cofactor-independent phosphoglycerate mutase [Nitrospirota bacterium]|nr:cofactor-independent phosphoglycerate mutase [Nitrospirota bacterium]
MKYIVLLGDGMADRPMKELDGKTPLQAARTPNMDRLAQNGITAKVQTVPGGYPPGSDVANLSVMGYDPKKFYTGRSPLEAASMGVELAPTDVAYRCNVVTLRNGDSLEPTSLSSSLIMDDFSGGHISTEEARELILAVDKELGSESVRFHPGVSYRHLMVWKNGLELAKCTPPHDISGKAIGDHLPGGEGMAMLRDLMTRSIAVLGNHEVNKKRIAKGKKPANCIWLWGQGRKPSMPTYKEKYGLSGAVISAVDLTKGLGIYAGFEVLNVPGATGYIDTNYSGKAEYALKALETVDYVYLHVEAPDEAGHNGDLKAKIQAIEDFDAKVVGAVVEGMKRFGDHRILVMPDHPTPIEIKTHSSDPVPAIVFDSTGALKGKGAATYDEGIVTSSRLVFEDGHRLMDFFIGDK